ncbi:MULTISPECIES: putative T6SS immunity periplasmic lipoprotein [Erwinia]|uniref:putative T6SS immunity periplasmic lipoprotein n=1 Tax=Erwinia TaxID=551 RepID=UPI00105CD382|nr:MULTISPECIES: putative T6SS immunity periplasmic lipoprotein [Erwinia]MBP2155670.1 hypothetical protein [Erwinia rhapontici]MCS3606025.1 hypothetical protein [Erwinia rhapontici]NNS05848.1 hypothetical protein [Erwinia sp. JH02]TDS98372.1 hypothetical protein EDF84_10660 [Erwinia rhapontici]
MKIKVFLFPLLISSLLTGCWLLGDYTPLDEIGQVSRTNSGFCFQIKRPGDYYVHYLSIRDRNAPERSGFNRELPALSIAKNQVCIPQAYYHFPNSGEINVEFALRSPTKKMKRRWIASEFRMVDGEPQPFTPREYSVPTADYMREKE